MSLHLNYHPTPTAHLTDHLTHLRTHHRRVPSPCASPPLLLVVDCAPNPDNCGGTGGCEGSIQPLAFEYLLGAGVETRANYTYTGKDGTCADDENGPAAATIDSYGLLPENCDEETLKQYVGRGILTTH